MQVDWPAPPLIPGNWKTLSLADACSVLALYSANEIKLGFEPSALVVEYSAVRASTLMFAPKWLLIEALAHFDDGSEGYLTFFYGPGRRVISADWLGPTLVSTKWHHSTHEYDIAHVKEYMHLFTNYIYGEDGRFIIIESESDLSALLSADAKPGKKLTDQIMPFEVIAKENKQFEATGTLAHAGKLYNVRFILLADGKVEMTAEDLLGDISMRDEYVHGPYRIFKDSDDAQNMIKQPARQ